jgi:hypothetical protein
MIDGNAFGGYPGSNFLQNMAGPTGFGGQMPGQGSFLGSDFMQPKQQHHGMNPLMMLSPLMSAFASGHPNIGLGMISPALGIARALGAFK